MLMVLQSAISTLLMACARSMNMRVRGATLAVELVRWRGMSAISLIWKCVSTHSNMGRQSE